LSGADQLAREWAEDRGVDVDPYPADWDNIDRPAAVVKRNRRGKLYDEGVARSNPATPTIFASAFKALAPVPSLPAASSNSLSRL
jgi:hypothetical protein